MDRIRDDIKAAISRDSRSQADLARAVGITPRSLNRYLQEGRGLGVQKLGELSHVLGLDLRAIAAA